MADETELEQHLAELAESGRRRTVPLTADRVRARGEQRLRRKRAAVTSGGALLVAALAVGGLSLARATLVPEPAAVSPTPTAGTPTPGPSSFVPPSPAPGEEYASELGYVYDAVTRGDAVRVTVEQLRTVHGTVAPTGVVHTLTLPRETLVEARQLSGGHPADVSLGGLVGQLAAGPRWMFAIDYDAQGRVESLREAVWLTG
ncbi:hypothetical protein LK07_16175 [Streptomyces pluripotens]|uniref:Uncharacterized protein n=1 Tax=Streptomyces pluripotens TaxID=1355015 RepID=A0A221NZR5_9ACTN|nr:MULTISPECIES: hypothetical protein [Streptomyces]ARP71057.1 hypothetical protein LK06_015040 [Streptomyces pluripotens]ASN25306.1 hypothetical protein LK07_16175 [Streptomyces pluripotens]KIE25943.1 membrane protein [Streptomyces sp. MUSC 125]MCH0557173.1 hypothetical protein [Streptomyces sp. MUM 16J]